MRKDLVDLWNEKEYHQKYLILDDSNAKTISDICKPITDNSKVLDVGCGVSRTGMYLVKNRKNLKYFGQDISSTALKMAKKRIKGAKLVHHSCSKLLFNSNYFDFVISTYAIEHFSEPKKVLDEMIRVCKPGGKLIIVSPAWDAPVISPPVLNRTIKKRLKSFYVQSKRQAGLILLKKTDFHTIDPPKHTIKEYSEDTDTVYHVSIREVMEYLKKRGCKIEYVHQRRLPLVRYFFRYMHIVAKKPAER